MLHIVRREAFAYLKLGMLSSRRRHIVQKTAGKARLGVLFVPGVGANGSQFLAMKAHLQSHADWFGSFEYFSLRHPRSVAEELATYLETVSEKCERVLVVGHSLGGLLLRMVLQSEARPTNIVGYVAICAPLHGTWQSKLVPSRSLRALAPDSDLMAGVLQSAHHLKTWGGHVLTIAARYDQMIRPHTSALLDDYPQLVLEDTAHASSLLDRRVHERVAELIRSLD